jgi:hypothetical protein
VKSGGRNEVYRRFCFTGIRFTNLQSSSSSESVSFSYATVVERVSRQQADGSLDSGVIGGWDLSKNQPFGDVNC